VKDRILEKLRSIKSQKFHKHATNAEVIEAIMDKFAALEHDITTESTNYVSKDTALQERLYLLTEDALKELWTLATRITSATGVCPSTLAKFCAKAFLTGLPSLAMKTAHWLLALGNISGHLAYVERMRKAQQSKH
jgi:hypothetical protein